MCLLFSNTVHLSGVFLGGFSRQDKASLEFKVLQIRIPQWIGERANAENRVLWLHT